MVALVEGAALRQGLALIWVGVAVTVAVLAGLSLIAGTMGWFFVARARAVVRRWERSQARPGLTLQPDDAAMAAAIAVALAVTEEAGAGYATRSADGAPPGVAWALSGRQRLMNNQPTRYGR